MNNYIEHHGIKGQKWGVRRFQNDDGTYTSAGRARQHSSGGKNKNNKPQLDLRVETRKSHRSETLKEARKKNINEMSDDELRQYNNRLQLEQNFERLREDNYSRAQNFIVKSLTTAALTAAASYAMPKIIERGSDFINTVLDSRHYTTL